MTDEQIVLCIGAIVGYVSAVVGAYLTVRHLFNKGWGR